MLLCATSGLPIRGAGTTARHSGNDIPVIAIGREPLSCSISFFLAVAVCELLESLGPIGQISDGQYDLPLTQVDLTDTLGLSNVHVNRVLQALRRDGLISLRGRSLQILARRRLCQLAEFEAGHRDSPNGHIAENAPIPALPSA